MQPPPLTLFAEEPRASHSVSPDSERDWLTRVATWPLSFLGLLTQHAPAGWSGRTSPACLAHGPAMSRQVIWRRAANGDLQKEVISDASWEPWQNSGMGGPTECLTLSTSEWTGTSTPSLSAGSVCSLSDILETGDVPQRYFLSATACRGILRRAARRGKELPPQLAHALLAVADTVQTLTAMAG
jgi:hypothetical protein